MPQPRDYRDIRFGIGGISGQSLSTHPDAHGSALRQTLGVVEAAEEAGLDAAFVAEHHFSADGYVPSPIPLLAALAVRTSQIELGTGVALAPFYHPLRLAEDVAVVDQLSAGRVILGLGLGYRDAEFAAYGIDRSRRVHDLERVIDVLRRSWTDALPAGEYGGETAVRPLPAQAGGPRLWLGAFAQAGVRRARRLADGYLATLMPRASFVKRVGWLAELGPLEEAFDVGATVTCIVTDGAPSTSVARGVDHVTGQYQRWSTTRSGQATPAPTGSGDGAHLRPGDYQIIGTPAQVIDGIRPWIDALAAVRGARRRYLTLMCAFPGVGLDDIRTSLRLFATDVKPALV